MIFFVLFTWLKKKRLSNFYFPVYFNIFYLNNENIIEREFPWQLANIYSIYIYIYIHIHIFKYFISVNVYFISNNGNVVFSLVSDNNPGLAYITSKQYAVKYEVC